MTTGWWRVVGAIVVGAWAGCGNPPTTAPAIHDPPATAAKTVAWRTQSARRESAFCALPLPPRAPAVPGGTAGAPFTRMEISSATGPEKWLPARMTLWAGAPRGAVATGPVVDQLVGNPTVTVDAGTVLSEVAYKDGQDLRGFELPAGVEGMALWLRLEVPPLTLPGEYVFPVALVGADQSRVETTLTVNVSDITLPSDTRVIALATATVEEMGAAYPEIFSKLQATYLDRSDEEHKDAVDQLDALVRAAQRNGVAFYLEGMAPLVKIDEVGRVLVEWDGYDRVVGPYLDGSAFADRTPLPVWLAPAPPRRIRDTPTQLRQYLQSCADHYKEKGWTQTPAFMHAALVAPPPICGRGVGVAQGRAGSHRAEPGPVVRARGHAGRDQFAQGDVGGAGRRHAAAAGDEAGVGRDGAGVAVDVCGARAARHGVAARGWGRG